MSAASVVRPDLTTIVVTYENADVIERCLAAVGNAARRYSQEIMLIDNASSDGTPALAAQVAPDAEIVVLDRNVGFAAANNLAISRARGRFVALVNSDCFPDPGSLDLLLDALCSRPRAGLVGGRLRYAGGRHQSSAGQLPTLWSELWLALALHRLPLSGRLGVGILFSPHLYNRPRRVGWVSGAFCVARREIGALPQSGFMYGEDVEWAAQARQRGFEAWLEPRACAVHLGAASVRSTQIAGYIEAKRVEAVLRWFARRGSSRVAAERAILSLHAVLRLTAAMLSLPLRPRRAVVAIRRSWTTLRMAITAPVANRDSFAR